MSFHQLYPLGSSNQTDMRVGVGCITRARAPGASVSLFAPDSGAAARRALVACSLAPRYGTVKTSIHGM